MRRAAWIGVLALALLAASATPSHAWRGAWSGGGGGHSSGGGGWHGGRGWHGGHVHGRFFVGPGFWWGAPYPYWGGYYGDPYYAPYYAYAPPVVVQEQQSYVEAAPEPAPPQPKAYWYYCASARAYYPTAPTCPEVWIKVPPRSE